MTAATRPWLEAILRRQLARVAALSASLGTVDSVAIDRAAAAVLAAVDQAGPADILTGADAAAVAAAADHREQLRAALHLYNRYYRPQSQPPPPERPSR